VSIATNTQSGESGSLADKGISDASIQDGVKYDLPTLLPFVIAVALLAALAMPILKDWYWEYTKPESYYAHAPMIPFICGLMFWYKRDIIARIDKRPDYLALHLSPCFLA